MPHCTTCNAHKPDSEFYASHPRRCKECCRAQTIRNMKDKPDYYRIYREVRKEEDWRASLATQPLLVATVPYWRGENPEKTKAQVALGGAVRNGKLTKPKKCSRCKVRGNVYGFIKDFSKPLEVEWLCWPDYKAQREEAAKMRRASVFDQINPSEWEGLDTSFHGGRFRAVAKCSNEYCSAAHSWSSQRQPSCETVIKKFRLKGWGFRHGKPLCPHHLHPKKEIVVMAEVEPKPTLTVHVATPEEKAAAARELRRLAQIAIEPNYDEPAQRYRPGHTDITIAKAVGGRCTVAIVTEVREMLYGPATQPEPDEAQRLRTEMALLEERLIQLTGDTNKARSELGGLQKRLTKLCEDMNWTK